MNIINYYASGITADGFVTLLDNNLKDIGKVYYLTGAADYSDLFHNILRSWEKSRYTMEYLHNPFENGALEGIINLSLNIAVIADICPYYNEYKDGRAEIYDFRKALDAHKYAEYRNSLIEMNQNKFSCLQSALLYFAKALKVHDEWEKVYRENMNFTKADGISDGLITRILRSERAEKAPTVKHRFLGAATPEGAVNFIPDLTCNIEKRFFIKGRPGTGKSTILKKIVESAFLKGFDTEIYHCGFDPSSLDMVIIRELGIAIFDSTAPHENNPDRAEDEIVDVFKETVDQEAESKYNEVLSAIAMRYKADINIATSYLKTMKEINDEIVRYHQIITDNNIMEEIKNEIYEKLSVKSY